MKQWISVLSKLLSAIAAFVTALIGLLAVCR